MTAVHAVCRVPQLAAYIFKFEQKLRGLFDWGDGDGARNAQAAWLQRVRASHAATICNNGFWGIYRCILPACVCRVTCKANPRFPASSPITRLEIAAVDHLTLTSQMCAHNPIGILHFNALQAGVRHHVG